MQDDNSVNAQKILNRLIKICIRPSGADSGIASMLSLLGGVFGLSRVVIFEPINNLSLWGRSFEWASEARYVLSHEQDCVACDHGWQPDFSFGTTESFITRLLIYNESLKKALVSSGTLSGVMSIIENSLHEPAAAIFFEQCDGERVFSEEECDFFEIASGVVGQALLRLHAEREARLDSAIISISSKLSEGYSPLINLDVLLKDASLAVGADAALFYLDEHGQTTELDCIGSYCIEEIFAAELGQYFHKLGKNAVYEELLSSGTALKRIGMPVSAGKGFFGTAIILPVSIKAELRGFFVLFHKSLRVWSKKEVSSLLMLSGIFSLSFENSEYLETLLRAEKANRSILNSTLDYVIMIDVKGRIVACNDSFMKSLGDEAVGVIGKDYFSMLPPELDTSYEELLSFMYGKHDNIQLEYFVRDMWYSIHMNKILDGSGRPVACTLFIRDVTKEKNMELELQKSAEAASRANRQKSDFIASISHEIRTPLNIILGHAYLLKNQSNPDSSAAYAENISFAAENLLSIVNNLIDLTRIEEGMVQSVPAKTALRELLERLRSLFLAEAERKGLYIKLEVSDDVPAEIVIDGIHLHQVISNLVSNAIKYTITGGVTISALVNNSVLSVEVSDTGKGIPDDERELVFRKFERGKTEAFSGISGAGLGLSIVHGMVHQMGGFVTLDSEAGKGSRFTVFLPFSLTDEKNTERKVTSWAGKGMRALVVDDNAMNVSLLEEILKAWGIDVETAEDGFGAISKCRIFSFDIIFMDHMMPRLDGVEAAIRLRKKGVKAPIVALTANAVDDYIEKYLEAGMNDALQKPVSPELLEIMLKKYLDCTNKK